MGTQETLPGLEHTVSERAIAELRRGLLDLGVVDSYRTPGAGQDEAKALAGYLEEARLLAADEPAVTEVAVSFELISRAMPEQYDLYRGDRKIGYLRLRHGYFRAHYPDHHSPEAIYGTTVRGDGSFSDEDERSRVLHAAAVEILRADGVDHPAPIFELDPYPEEDYDDESSLEFLRELGKRAAAKREALSNQFEEDLQTLLDEAVASGASPQELAELLKDGGFIAATPRSHYRSGA